MRLGQRMQQGGHQPVLQEAALAALAVRPGGIYIDATYGRGGHSAAILEELRGRGRLLALDRDPEAATDAEQQWGATPHFRFEQANFAQLGAVVTAAGIRGRVDGILFDLGVSSPQLEDASRGFSFARGGPLDMRMDPAVGESAADWLARAEIGAIARVLRDYGDERLHRRIARAIVRARESAPIDTTDRLAAIVTDAVPAAIASGQRIHPATRTFQALRIYINNELDALRAALQACPQALAAGGRLAVISFHSLEDRIVKRYLRELSRPEPPPVPMAPIPQPVFCNVSKPRRPEPAELYSNPRARSAVLRVAQRTEVPA